MHKLLDYICDELEMLEKKVGKGEKLSMSEISYMDTLAHAKKNILTADAMEDADEYRDDYSGARMGRGRGSNARRDSMGRYASRYDRGYSRADAKEDLIMDLHDLEKHAGDEETRHMIKKWIKQVEE